MLVPFTSDKQRSEQTTDPIEEWISSAGDTIVALFLWPKELGAEPHWKV